MEKLHWEQPWKTLFPRLWAFPLSGGSPLQWVLGWVDWSIHKMSLFKGVGRAPDWAKKDLQHAAAGLDYHSPTKDLQQRDIWSSGLFVMMAMHGLPELSFYDAKRSKDQAQSSSVFQTMKHHLKPASRKNLIYQAIHSLDRHGNLLHIYTQNINAMEKTAGLLSYGVPLADQIVVSKEELPNLDAILDHDKNLVDVVLVVGVQPMPYSDLSLLIKQFTQAAQSRTQAGSSSSILMDLDISTLENAGIPELFQISLELDLQDFFRSIISAAYQDARHNPTSNTMLVPKKLITTDFSLRLCDNQEEEEEENLGQDQLLLTLSPWHLSVL
ncbi:hypothetical protein BD769DRAFT_1384275 [Suillus cothurnatus]|nr:hypothetical protein BD769DRAFT_1384275 [Suillus cothurnatus]